MLNTSAFDKLDRIIHEMGRLKIVSLLAANTTLSFSDLKRYLEMTDGNLSVHMRTLEECGYVAVRKSFVNRKPRTEYSLTPAGRKAFEEHLRALETIVRDARAGEEEKPAREAGSWRLEVAGLRLEPGA